MDDVVQESGQKIARTRAAMVEITPIPNLTVSFESALRCCSGRTVRRNRPISADPKTHAKTINRITMEFMINTP